MRFKEWRKKKGYTQQQVVDMMDPPCSQGNLSRFENGKDVIPAHHITTIRKLTRGKVKECDWEITPDRSNLVASGVRRA